MKGIYIVGGYPDMRKYIEVLKIIKDTNIDFVEIGLPFNDPVADGKIIAEAINRVIEKNYKIDDILIPVKEILNNKKLYVMTYANIVYRNLNGKFQGFNGLIIADCPNRLHSFFYEKGLKIPIIPFATSETGEIDIEFLKRSKGDFIYFIGIRGTTGGKLNLNDYEVSRKIKEIRRKTGKKIIFGFGLKTKEDIDNVMKFSDGFVIGTEIVRKQDNILNLKKIFKSLEFL